MKCWKLNNLGTASAQAVLSGLCDQSGWNTMQSVALVSNGLFSSSQSIFDEEQDHFLEIYHFNQKSKYMSESTGPLICRITASGSGCAVT